MCAVAQKHVHSTPEGLQRSATNSSLSLGNVRAGDISFSAQADVRNSPEKLFQKFITGAGLYPPVNSTHHYRANKSETCSLTEHTTTEHTTTEHTTTHRAHHNRAHHNRAHHNRAHHNRAHHNRAHHNTPVLTLPR
jgi:hypothetical protein